jgi:ABC-type glycerol-3-phosphate transport system substrate-binding protein
MSLTQNSNLPLYNDSESRSIKEEEKLKAVKWLLYALTVMLICLWVSACSPGSDSTVNSDSSDGDAEVKQSEGGQTTKNKTDLQAELKLLRVWGELEDWKRLIADFNKEYPNIKVEVMEQPYHELPALIAAGEIPDVVGMVGTMPDWVENGILEELTKYVETDPDVSPDIFYDVAYTRSVTPDGKLWGLPWHVDPNFALMYNRSILDEYGVTEIPNLDSLQAMGDFLGTFWDVRNGEQIMTTFMPHSETYGPVNSLQTWAYLNGARTETFYDPETRKVSFNDPIIVEALEWILDFKRQHVNDDRINQLHATLPEGMNRFQAGKSAVMVQTSAELRIHYDMMPDEVGMIPMPSQAIWTGGWSFAMTAGGKQKEAAWELLKWITSTNEGAEATLKYFDALSGKRENPYLDQLAQTDPVYAVFKEVMEKSERDHLWTWIPVEWATEFDEKWWSVMDGSMEPRAFLDHMTSYIQKLVDEKYGE